MIFILKSAPKTLLVSKDCLGVEVIFLFTDGVIIFANAAFICIINNLDTGCGQIQMRNSNKT